LKLKLDENMDRRLVPMLQASGLDVDTVHAEALSGVDDQTLYETCIASQRVLVTLDLDFSNPLRFPPDVTVGIIVIRPLRPVLSAIRAALVSVLPQLQAQALRGRLWIVEPGRLRVYDPSRSDDV